MYAGSENGQIKALKCDDWYTLAFEEYDISILEGKISSFDADNLHLLATNNNSSIYIWDISTYKLVDSTNLAELPDSSENEIHKSSIDLYNHFSTSNTWGGFIDKDSIICGVSNLQFLFVRNFISHEITYKVPLLYFPSALCII